MTTEKIKITMSERHPLSIDPKLWPVIAQAEWHDGQVLEQANNIRRIKVREHADGRRIVYGFQCAGNGGQHAGTRNPEAGFMIDAPPRNAFGGPIRMTSDGVEHIERREQNTIRAIRRIAGVLNDDGLGEECIADLPAENIDEDEDSDSAAPAAINETLATLLALLVQAAPHVPEPLRSEIRAALAGKA